jgi:hypothetical protein
MRITDYDTIAYGQHNEEKKENNEMLDLLDTAIEYIEIKCNIGDILVKTKNDKEILIIAMESVWLWLK